MSILFVIDDLGTLTAGMSWSWRAIKVVVIILLSVRRNCIQYSVRMDISEGIYEAVRYTGLRMERTRFRYMTARHAMRSAWKAAGACIN